MTIIRGRMNRPEALPSPAPGDRCLVTGAAGFIGSHVARALLEGGAEVHALVRPGTDLGRIAGCRPRLHVHRADLRDSEAVSTAWEAARPEVVVHAAIFGVHPGRRGGEEMVATNVLGTHHLLACCRRAGVRRLVVLGGSSEYGRRTAPMKEEDPPEPVSLYGATKAMATLLCQQAARRHGVPVVVLRPFSVYGPGEPRHRLIPTAIRRALDGGPLRLTGPGWRRDFVYVEDVVEAVLRTVALEGHAGEIVNVGSGLQTGNEEVVALVDRLTGGGLEVLAGAYPPHPTDARHWVADVGKAEKVLGWRPRTDLEEGLRRTVAWFSADGGSAP